MVYPERETTGRTRRYFRILEKGARRYPGIDYDRQGKECGDDRCPQCARRMTWNFLQGYKVDSVPCDARCTGARGHTCECSCGGKNHGMDWAGGSAGTLI